MRAMVRRNVAALLTLSVLGILGPAQESKAATASWAAPLDGAYTLRSNWVGNLAPTPTDNPVYSIDGTYTVTFGPAISSYSFQVDAGGAV
jgi:hypothetical protein